MSQFSEQEKNQLIIDTKPLLEILTKLEDNAPSSEEYEDTIFEAINVFLYITLV